MSKQDHRKRIGNFDEVALGYSAEQAQIEAERCLQCKKPLCVAGCPVEVNIPKFLGEVVTGNMPEAVAALKETNKLPAICGRVCPQESQCEGKCVLGRKGEPIAIGALERYVADWALQNDFEPTSSCEVSAQGSKSKVAIIGSGPAGLTCASDLATLGYDVTIFEALHKTGGVLRYGIPEFRLPKAIVDYEVSQIKNLGVKIETSQLIGQTLSLHDLKEMGFGAIFIGAGAGLPYFLGIPGESLNGVYSANEFLTRVNLMKAYLFPEYDTPVLIGDKVAVIGGGNVAMDAARTAKRLGASEVTVVYRRSREEMPARLEEIENAEEEGINFNLLTSPLEITSSPEKAVQGLVCQRMELGEPDASGRRRPLPIKGSEFTIALDSVIVAVGQGPNPIVIRGADGLTVSKWGYIDVDSETKMSSLPGIFAGGDIVEGAGTVIAAMGDGRKAARAIDRYLAKNN